MSLPVGHDIHDVHVDGNARAHFGDQHFAGGLTVNAKAAPLTDYNGLYAHNALAPVSTYVDRPNLRRQLEAQLHDRIEHALPKTKTVIVQGIGGVGKTQLVLDYIQRHRKDYSGVFWIEASRPEAIERDYVQMYSLLYNVGHEAGADKIQLQHAVLAVKKWFYERGKRALFIFDNADAIRDKNDPCYIDLRRFLPDDPNIHVILTTRDRLALELSDLPAVEVDEMRPEEAVTLFRRQAKISISTREQKEQIAEIVRTLGYLALATTLAASYVAATPRLQNNLACFLPEYHERRKDLLAQRPMWLVHQYGQSVLTTWETTFAAMEALNPGASQFLELLSFFNNDDIPLTFPTGSRRRKVPNWNTLLLPSKRVNENDVEEFFRVLAGFSFVKYRADQNSYSMHSLIQAWAYDRLTPDQQQHYCYLGAITLENMTYHAKTMAPRLRDRFIPHVVSGCYKISKVFESAPAEHRQLVKVLDRLAYFLSYCGYLKEEVVVRRSTLSKCQSWYGEDDHDTLESMDLLAATLGDVGLPREALTLHRTVVNKREQTLSSDDPRIQQAKYGLVQSLWDNGKHQEALSLQRDVLKEQRQILGDDHRHTLRSEVKLADMLADTGKLNEGISMHRLIVEKHRRVLGLNDIETLISEHNLVVSLAAAGETREALPIIREVVDRRRWILGENHPITLNSVDRLAFVLCELGKLDEALSVQKDVVMRVNEHLAPDHQLRVSAKWLLENIERRIAGGNREAGREAEEEAGESELELELEEAEEIQRPRRKRRIKKRKKGAERMSMRSSLSSLIERFSLKS